jgi:hypothetical protein
MIQPAAAAVQVVPAVVLLAALVHLSLHLLLLQCCSLGQERQPRLLLCNQQQTARLQVTNDSDAPDGQRTAQHLSTAVPLAQAWHVQHRPERSPQWSTAVNSA